jgi:hypothetical protein
MSDIQPRYLTPAKNKHPKSFDPTSGNLYKNLDTTRPDPRVDPTRGQLCVRLLTKYGTVAYPPLETI